MAIYSPITLAQVQGNAQSKLVTLQSALEAVNAFHLWLSAYTITDLQTLGYSAADAQSLTTAFADANELYILFNGGTLGTYTLPYNFSASQRVITGPAAS